MHRVECEFRNSFPLSFADVSPRFLWAKLLMDSLVDKTSEESIRKALDVLPSTLYDTYGRAMQRIDNQEPNLRLFAQKALVLLDEPMTVTEL